MFTDSVTCLGFAPNKTGMGSRGHVDEAHWECELKGLSRYSCLEGWQMSRWSSVKQLRVPVGLSC